MTTDAPDASAETAPARDEAGSESRKERKPDAESSEASVPTGERIVEKWMASVSKSERPRRQRIATPTKGSTDVLKKWVEGDDSVLENWIQASEPPPVPASPPPHLTEELGLTAPGPQPPVAPSAGPSERGGGPGSLASVGEREATLVRWLTDLLDRVKSDQFEPHSLLQELQDTQRQLYDERQKRKQMEEELEHVKRGSIAVIKYVRNREAKSREQLVQEMEGRISELQMALDRAGTEIANAPAAAAVPDARAAATESAGGAEGLSREAETRIRAEFAEREHGYIERETELRRRQIQLEEETRNLRSELELAKRRMETVGSDERSLTAALQSRMNTADMRERELARRENELRTKFEEIRLQTEEVERRRVPLEYKEKELQAWDQELRVQKEAVALQARRVEEAKIAGVTLEAAEKSKRLAEIQSEVTKKEEELRAREEFLQHRMHELEGLEKRAAEAEVDKAQAEVTASASAKKVQTGVRRLDDLLFGGIPTGSQLLINGPAHTGKDVLARGFIAEGLREGAGAIWVLTDKTYQTVREEATGFLPNYAELEQKGLVKYIDLYSRSLGLTEGERNAVLLSMTDKGALDSLTTKVNEFAQEFKQKGLPYRIVFESVSTITAYLDTTATFRFLQPFVGRRKVDGAAGYYLIETGMHSEADIRTLEHMMDGSINLKIDQLKNFLSVRGITDVQSRAWVGYTFTKRAFSLGSFSLDKIR